MQQRLKEYVNKAVSEEQAGFRQSRGTIDQTFLIRQLAEKYTQQNKISYNNVINVILGNTYITKPSSLKQLT